MPAPDRVYVFCACCSGLIEIPDVRLLDLELELGGVCTDCLDGVRFAVVEDE